MTKRTTKNALLMSILSLILCMSMLVSTTFAWFTDEAHVNGNLIQTGNLDIALEKYENGEWVDATTGAIFDYSNWEPGYTQVVHLRVRNLGTLALKWQATSWNSRRSHQ